MKVDSTNIDLFWLEGESRINQYQQIEGPIGPEYEKHKKWLIKFGDKNVCWDDYSKSTEIAQYIEQHQADIDTVIKVEGIISQIAGMTTQEYTDLIDILGNFLFS